MADQQLAREIGIAGIPALLISIGERGTRVSGAQPHEVVERALEQALNQHQFAGHADKATEDAHSSRFAPRQPLLPR